MQHGDVALCEDGSGRRAEEEGEKPTSRSELISPKSNTLPQSLSGSLMVLAFAGEGWGGGVVHVTWSMEQQLSGRVQDQEGLSHNLA